MISVKDTCHLPAETGDCANYVDRWYYDTKEKTCRQFYYGGCGGNANNFETQQRCQEGCDQKEAIGSESEPPYRGTQPQPTAELQTTEVPEAPFTPGKINYIDYHYGFYIFSFTRRNIRRLLLTHL